MTIKQLIEQRKAENEDAFRSANERIERASAMAGATASQAFLMHCECADLDCHETVELTIEQYEQVRIEARRFVVVEGHEDESDQVVERVAGYLVIEKTGVEGRVVAALDARSREDDLRVRDDRVARNENVYRAVNERIVDASNRLMRPTDHIDVACECGNLGCAQLLRVRVEDYQDVRSHPSRFLIARGHRTPDTEVLVHRRGEFEVVEKIGIGARRAQEAVE
ncbi:MAG: hypothetical protein JWL76_615 [Thermoleophilia bacterium]|nr:hypothetical protein [Thermoleophilia bacterium]